MNNRITPNNITYLQDNEIFVFGSNEAGIHGAFAARLALDKFGAIYNQGYGLQGRSFAIPTKDHHIQALELSYIRPYVNRFIEFAQYHPQYKFLVTAIGCGAAGYTANNIAPMFKDAIYVNNIYLPKSFWDVLISNKISSTDMPKLLEVDIKIFDYLMSLPIDVILTISKELKILPLNNFPINVKIKLVHAICINARSANKLSSLWDKTLAHFSYIKTPNPYIV